MRALTTLARRVQAFTAPAATAEEALELMRRASSRLAFASTHMNHHSSRSHAVCQLFVAKNRGKPGGAAGAGGDALAGAQDHLKGLSRGAGLPQRGSSGLRAEERASGGERGKGAAKAWRRKSVEVRRALDRPRLRPGSQAHALRR